MLIRKIIIENFGLYEGRQEFDLTPRVKYRRTRPIILFGGKNGSGKTTLMEAVRLALYGRTALGSRVRQVDYDSHLRNRIHRPRGDLLPTNRSAVGLEFDYVRRGEKKTYFVERSWTVKGRAGVDEEFRVLEDHKPLIDVDRDVLEAFAREIVPEGLSQLFFFDGEKIRELAEDDTSNEGLAESIKALLGLDTVDRLSADLSIYASRKTAELGAEDDRKKLADFHREIERLSHVKEQLDEKIAENTSILNGVEAEIRQHEERLQTEGQVFAEERNALKSSEAVFKFEIGRFETELRVLCDGVFPLALCPNTANRLRAQLDREVEHRRAGCAVEELSIARDELLEVLTAKKANKDFTGAVRTFFEDRFKKVNATASTGYLSLSEGETEAVVRWLDETQSRSGPAVQRLCRELEAAYRGLERAVLELTRMPQQDVVRPTFMAIQQLNQRVGSLKQEGKELEVERDRADLQTEEIRRKQARIELAIKSQGKINETLKDVDKVRSALSEYLTELTARKIGDLQQAVADCFNHLSRKGDVIQRIEIHPASFQVTLYDRSGTAISKNELSSGEKQIYAIAMLWGLAKTSGRPLPVIIDTPLGRLDSDHRLNLCREYFPHASHQVILLSTDTEVDQSLFKELSPHLSHSFHLVFDSETVRTTAAEEYFWKEPAHV